MCEKLIINKRKKLEYVKDYKINNGNGLLIKNLYCGICSSDLKIIKNGHRALVYPMVPGHEIVGKIENIHSSFNYLKKKGLEAGDIVQVYPGITCGNCKYCKTERQKLCETIKIIGFNYEGGFSSYTFFRQDIGDIYLTKIPGNKDLHLYTLAEPIASCVNLFENIQLYKNDTLLIIGGGLMGQLLSIVGDYYGIKKQYIIDFNFNHRFKESTELFPANLNIIKVTKQNEIDMIKNINPDIVIMATGNFPYHYELINILNKGSRICYFSGLSGPISKEKIDLNQIHYKEITIRGFYGSNPDHNEKALKIINLYMNLIKLSIGIAIYPISEYKSALKDAYSRKFQKVIFKL